jgi:hypothetical protein
MYICTTKTNNMENFLNKSTEKRALDLIIEKGLNPLDAVKQALTEEMELINSMFNATGNKLSERGQLVCDRMMNRTYIKLH